MVNAAVWRGTSRIIINVQTALAFALIANQRTCVLNVTLNLILLSMRKESASVNKDTPSTEVSVSFVLPWF